MSPVIQIAEIPTAYGTIAISRNRATGTLIYTVGGRQQGAIDSSGTSLAYYIHAIFGLLTQAGARHVMMIGGAGCTLGTLLDQAGCRVTIVDVNPASFAVAREHFGLPDRVICHAAEGGLFLKEDSGLYDAIVLDAFHGDDIPGHLQTPDFFALARARLAPGGAMFVNVLVKNDFDSGADHVARGMKSAWEDVRLLDCAGVHDRNAIVMAGDVVRLREPDLLVRPVTNPHVIATELHRMKFRSVKTRRWGFGG